MNDSGIRIGAVAVAFLAIGCSELLGFEDYRECEPGSLHGCENTTSGTAGSDATSTAGAGGTGGSGGAVVGSGGCVPESDMNECTNDVCDADGTALHENKPTGEACSDNGGKVCDGNGLCVECIIAADCLLMLTCDEDTHTCSPPTCDDGGKNGDETDVDCGGSCLKKCGDGQSCTMPLDCISAVCDVDSCCTPEAQPATCVGKCGNVANNCGQLIDCGGCVGPNVCGGGNPGIQNVCGCSPPCPVWSRRFGGFNSDRGTATTIDPAGNVLVAGYVSTSNTDFGGGPISDSGPFLAKFSDAGLHVWSYVLLSSGCSTAASMVTEAPSSLLVACLPVVPNATNPGPIHRFDSNGSNVGSMSCGGHHDTGSIATDSAGNVVSTFAHDGPINCGPPTFYTSGIDVVVAKFNQQGDHLWVKRFGDPSPQSSQGVAVDKTDNIILVGGFAGTVNFGGSDLVNSGGSYAFVAKLGPDGEHQWSKSFNVGEALGVVVDGADNIVVAVKATGNIDMGCGTLVGGGETDVVIAKLAPNGTCVWSKIFGDDENQIPRAIAVDGLNNTFIAGSFAGAVDFGGGPLISAGNTDVFLVKLDSAGNHVWSQRFGDGASQEAVGIAADSLGSVVLIGHFGGSINFGSGALFSAGGEDAFVARFSP